MSVSTVTRSRLTGHMPLLHLTGRVLTAQMLTAQQASWLPEPSHGSSPCSHCQYEQMVPVDDRPAFVLPQVLFVTAQMLTAQQEARLEAASFPWCPDFWEMTNLLATKHKQAPAPLLLGLEVTGPALLPLLPLNSAFHFLTKPLMTRGLGMRLKRELSAFVIRKATRQCLFGTEQSYNLLLCCSCCA